MPGRFVSAANSGLSAGGRIRCSSSVVIAGLDPAIHAAGDHASPRRLQLDSMDHRVKPGGDESGSSLYIHRARHVRAFGVARMIPEKWPPVFRKDHAPEKWDT